MDPTGRLPSLLVIGAPKCATTSLFRYLDTHPEVFMAPEKELRFFTLNFHRGVEWYSSHFTRVGDARMAGEATPMYLADPDAAPRIASMLPDAKLVAILRHPAERAYSNYWHNKLRRGEARSFAEIVDDDLAREARGDPWKPTLVGLGRYGRQIERFSTYLERGRLQLLAFEDLRDDPAAVFAAICRFLEVDDSYIPPNLGETYNRPHRIRSPWMRNALIRTRVPSRAPRLARWLDRRLRDETDYPPIDTGVRRVLLDAYRADNASLATLWGRDLSSWDR